MSTMTLQLHCFQAPRRRPRRLAQSPRLSVIIVNYHQWEETDRLVRQLQASAAVRSGAAEIVIVDNHSPPHRLMSRLRRRRGVSLRRWGRNQGYARGVNEGCRLSRGDWFLLLNPDVSVDGSFLDGVLARADQLAEETPRAGIVGFQLRNSDGSLQHSCGRFPSLPGTLLGLALPRALRKYQRVHSHKRSRVSWVTGCCFLLKRECLHQLDGFDEDFFLYYEDVDFCRRARARGWTIWHEPALRVMHHRPLHLRDVPPHLRLSTRHALLTYAAKHWAGWQFRVLSGIVKIEAWLRERWARWRGDDDTSSQFAQLGTLATELETGRPRAARRRLDACVRRWERTQWPPQRTSRRHLVLRTSRRADAAPLAG